MSIDDLSFVPQGIDAMRPVLYRQGLHDLMHELGRKIKYPLFIKDREVPAGDGAGTTTWHADVRYVGLEYISPGTAAEYAEGNGEFLDLLREWRFAAVYKTLGGGAHKLLVAETETHRNIDDGLFNTRRSVFLVDWDDILGVHLARVQHTQIVSTPNVAGTPVKRPDGTVVTPLEAGEGDAFRHITDWETLTPEDFEDLEHRTADYGRELLSLYGV